MTYKYVQPVRHSIEYGAGYRFQPADKQYSIDSGDRFHISFKLKEYHQFFTAFIGYRFLAANGFTFYSRLKGYLPIIYTTRTIPFSKVQYDYDNNTYVTLNSEMTYHAQEAVLLDIGLGWSF